MRLTEVRTYLAGGGESADGWTGIKPFLLVKAVDADGREGWGEAYVLRGRETAVAALVRSLADAYAGRPAAPRPFLAWATGDFGDKRGGIDFHAAVSALELALWDLRGKALGAPVHALLGGALRPEVPLYANIWSDRAPDAAAMAERARQAVAAGFRAIKVYPLAGDGLEAAEARLAAIRQAVGPQTAVMIDVNGPDDTAFALEAGRRFAAYSPFWYEEPVTSDQPERLAEVRRQLGLRIVSGERHGGLTPFRRLLEAGVADVLNPDIAGCGGLLTLLEIAALAQSHGAGVSPHCYDSMGVGLAAALHASALLPNLVWLEYFPAMQAASAACGGGDLEIGGGAARLPTAPGLGVRVDEAALTPL